MKKLHQEIKRTYLKSHSRHYTGTSQKFKIISWHQNHTTKNPVPQRTDGYVRLMNLLLASNAARIESFTLPSLLEFLQQSPIKKAEDSLGSPAPCTNHLLLATQQFLRGRAATLSAVQLAHHAKVGTREDSHALALLYMQEESETDTRTASSVSTYSSTIR